MRQIDGVWTEFDRIDDSEDLRFIFRKLPKLEYWATLMSDVDKLHAIEEIRPLYKKIFPVSDPTRVRTKYLRKVQAFVRLFKTELEGTRALNIL